MLIAEMKKAVELCRLADVTSIVWGHRGLGKSAGHRQLAEEMTKTNPTGYCGFIDKRLSQIEASDLAGLPDRVYPDENRPTHGLTVYLPPADFPHGEFIDGRNPERTWGKPGALVEAGVDIHDHEACRQAALSDPECPDYLKEKGAKTDQVGLHCGLLFLDEPNRAEDDVLQAVFQLVLDRSIGRYKLPTGWSIHCAANYPEGDGYQVNNFADAAFLDRFCHLDLSFNNEYIQDWNLFMSRYDNVDKILQFVGTNRENLMGEVSGERGFSVQPSPRSWEAVAKIEAASKAAAERGVNIPDGVKDDVISGLIGTERAMQYKRFSVDVTPTDIIKSGLSAEIKSKLKKISGSKNGRNVIVGLTYGLCSFRDSIDGEDNKKRDSKIVVKEKKNVLSYMNWLAQSNERDLAVSLGRHLVAREADDSLAGALLSNRKLADIAAGLSKKKGGPKKEQTTSWLILLNEDEVLSKLMSKVSWGTA